MELTFIWMMLVLKIPIVALLWIVWWASRPPEPVEDEGGGGSDRRPEPHPPVLPQAPRTRGPHGAPLPAPPRVRTPVVRGRDLDRT